MATSPLFVGTPHVGLGSLSSANTNINGTGTIVNVFSAGSSGSSIWRIRVKATGTVTAGMIRIFRYNGTTYYLYKEIPVSATTPSGTALSWETEISYNNLDPLILPSGHSLCFSTNNAESFAVHVEGADY